MKSFFKNIQLQLVDFKLEFGYDFRNNIILGDEISPDNCRLWDLNHKNDTIVSLDKDRFRNDLEIDNLVAKHAGDYDSDGVHEVYWKTSDGSAYLRSLMHADGNIRYANYQSEAQMREYLTTNGDDSVITDIIS